MLETLRFVRGAVAEGGSLVPVLTHFCVYKKRLQGTNGRIYLDAPCAELPFETVVPAERFLRAVDACDGEPDMKITDTGRLIIKRGKFRAQLMTQGVDMFPLGQVSAGKKIKIGAPLLPVLKTLRPFMSSDAVRPWASTLLFMKGAAFGASNAMIASIKQGSIDKTIQLPVFAIDELLRIGNEPDHYAFDETSITFFWKDSWLRSQLIVSDWPVKTAEDWLAMKIKTKPLPKDLIAAIDRLIPFCPDPKAPVIRFKGDTIATLEGESQAEMGGFNVGEGVFRAENLKAMLAVADKMAITEKAAHFSGPDSFAGVMSLLRL